MIGWKNVFLILSLGCCHLIVAERGIDEPYDVEMDKEWSNPFEIGSPLPNAELHKGAIQSPHQVKKSATENSESDLRLLRVVKSFLRALQGSISGIENGDEMINDNSKLIWKMKISLSQSEFQLLKAYSQDLSSSTSLRDVEDALHSAFDSSEHIQERPPSSYICPSSFIPSYDPENAILILTFGLLLILSLAYFTGIIAGGKFFVGFVILCSIWKWLQLRNSKQLDKDMVCTDDDSWFSKYFYSSCSSKPKKDHLINPDLETNPILAVIDVFTEMVARPLPAIGDNLGKFFGSFWGQNGFFSAMFGYGFLLIVVITTIAFFTFALFYFGLPAQRRRNFERNEERDSSNDDKIRKLENQVHNLLTTISTLREVSIQSMEYNFRIEELKNNSRDAAAAAHRSVVSFPVKHLPPAIEDNPPYKKLKSVEYPCYENKAALDDSVQGGQESRGNKIVTSLSSDLILSPPSNFKNVSEEDKKKADKDKEEKDDAPEPPPSPSQPHVEDAGGDDDDFEVISKSTPPPERED